MTYEDFFRSVAIDEADGAKAIYYLGVRGISEHIFVANYLQSLKAEKVTYAEVATAFRYDKRIRRIIYKYIGFLEEYIRAYIVNKYENDYSLLNLHKKAYKGIQANKTFYETIIELTFGELVSQVLLLPQDDLNNLFRQGSVQQNLKALVGLRNEVNHNRFLLHNKSLKECQVGSIMQCSLYANIVNLANHLPKDLEDAFIEEINNAASPSEKKYASQIEWSLIPDIIIKVE